MMTGNRDDLGRISQTNLLHFVVLIISQMSTKVCSTSARQRANIGIEKVDVFRKVAECIG